MSQNLSNNRIQSIDLLRGVVMIIMALDHTRDYFHYDVFFYDPTDLTQTTPFLFFTRLMTHVCAPVFVFLAGTSAFLVGQRRGKNELSMWLVKRGIWLVIAEFTVVKFGWLFTFSPTTYFLGVIYVIGISMIVLAGMIHVPKKLVIVLSLLIIFGHNAFDGFQTESWQTIWILMHELNLINVWSFEIMALYPLIPWVFVMALGYHFGVFFTDQYTSERRAHWFRIFGLSALALFFVGRGLNVYGDLVPWESQTTWTYTVLSFFNLTKYPPSLMYLLLTLGLAMIFLSLAESWKGRMLDRIVVIGRVPMFYYIIHIFTIHSLALVAAELTGFGAESMVLNTFVSTVPELQGFGFDLWVVYLIWIGLILGLYPLCRWYHDYKKNNRDKWWLSYL